MTALGNRAVMTVASAPGTGTITLGSAVAGYQSFAAAGIATGSLVSYTIVDGTTSFECGKGVYTSSGTTLTRQTITDSSNGGAAIIASAAAQVFISPLAPDILGTFSLSASGYIKLPSGLIIQWCTTASTVYPTTSWPITFPNNCFLALACPYVAGQSAYVQSSMIASYSTSNFQTYVNYVANGAAAAAGTPSFVIGIGN